jgi:hypothetical protein
MHPRHPTRMAPLSWPRQLQRSTRTTGPAKPQVSETSPSPPAQHSRPIGPKIPVQGEVAQQASQRPCPCPRPFRLVCTDRDRCLLAEDVTSPSSPSSSSSSSSPPKDLGSQGVSCPPPPCIAPLPPPGQRSSLISFASIPTAVHYRHSWPPISPHPQVR